MPGAGVRESYGTKSTIAVKMRTTTTPDSNIDPRTVKFLGSGYPIALLFFNEQNGADGSQRACRRRGAQKSKMDGQWLRIVLRCCSDVVELDLSFKTRIRLSSNSSGVLRTRFRSVFGPFGARGRVSGALSGRFWAHF